MRAIIPAAGFGTRMNMPKDKSKELLDYEGKPLIQHTIDKCIVTGIEPLVLLRKEKQDLIDYCAKTGVSFKVVTPEGEWTDTVLQSQLHWHKHNVLLLPDTLFKPTEALNHLRLNLELGNKIVFGIHKVNDVSKWGQVARHLIIEKPLWAGPGYAWGIIGFDWHAGELLFRNMQQRSPFFIPDTSYILLDEFKDVTRGK